MGRFVWQHIWTGIFATSLVPFTSLGGGGGGVTPVYEDTGYAIF